MTRLVLSARQLRPFAAPSESVETFACFGSTCTVKVSGSGPAGPASDAAQRAKQSLLAWHERFSRFLADSELSRLNRDPRSTVLVSSPMVRFVQAAIEAAAFTHGLVDPTLVAELERAGYAGDLATKPVPLRSLKGRRRPAQGHIDARWRHVTVDPQTSTVTRPPGVQLDSGGVAKGLFGDWLATVLEGHESFAVDAGGDVRVGGGAGLVRPVRVARPFEDSVLHAFELARGAAATSGIAKRSWLDERGRRVHHLLDPATGRPALTGIVQVTALAPRGLEAETRAKAALLSGPHRARRWLPHGGVIVYDDGRAEVVASQLRGAAS